MLSLNLLINSYKSDSTDILFQLFVDKSHFSSIVYNLTILNLTILNNIMISVRCFC